MMCIADCGPHSGVGLLAILAGAFAAWFTEAAEKKEKDDAPTAEQLSMLIGEIRALRAEICELGVARAMPTSLSTSGELIFRDR